MSTLVNGVPMPTEFLWVYKVLHTSLAAAITVGVYDCLLTLANEWQYIWRHPKTHIWIKVTFLMLRYVSIFNQLARFIWDFRLLLTYPVPALICRNYRIFMEVSLLIQLYSIDFLMILRVWLVFSRGRKFLAFLILVFICQLCIVGVSTFQIFSNLNMNGLCMVRLSPLYYTLFWLAVLIVHTTSWVFTMYQCRRARRQAFGRTPLIWLLERDGTCCWLSFVVTVALDMIIGNKVSGALASMLHPWVISSVSILGCRMIINVQRLACKETEDIELSSSVLFTTVAPPFMSIVVQSTADSNLVDVLIDAQSSGCP